MSDHNAKPVKKRHRAALSCVACRERKIKCDRGHPCSQCVKRGDGHLCHIDEEKNRAAAESAARRAGGAARQSSAGAATSSSTNSTDPEEVSAIKARLAQLEAMISGQQNQNLNQTQRPNLDAPSSSASPSQSLSPTSSASPSIPLTTSLTQYSIHSPENLPFGRPQVGGNLPFTYSNNFPGLANSPSPGSYSSPLTSNSFSSLKSGRSPPSQTPGEPPRLPSISGTGALLPLGGARRRGSTSSSAVSSGDDQMPATEPIRAGSTGIAGLADSDTEDAALVLEGLAMGGGTLRGQTPSKETKYRSTVHDLIDKQPDRSFQRYLEADKKSDLMMGGAAQVDPRHSDTDMPSECIEAKLKQAQKAKEALEAGMDPSKLEETSCGVNVGNFKDEENLTPAEREKNRVCRAACSHDGIMRMKVGPETMLGWGLGWAFAAAEEMGEFRSIEKYKMGYLGAPEREAVLRVMIHSLPSRAIANQLITVYETRVRSLAGHVVHIPTLRKEMNSLYDLDSIEKRARVINMVDPGWLSMFLMILVLALRFYPCYPDSDWISCENLFDGKTIHIWFSAAKTALILARYQSSQSMHVLQAIILMHVHAADSGRTNLGLLRIAITNAQEMMLHRLGDKSRAPKEGEHPDVAIRRETAKRIWWALVFRDWCGAVSCSSAYVISPDRFNTPYPGNYNDAELLQYPTPPPHPSEVYTEMSYSLTSYDLAHAMRENVDLVNARDMEAAADGRPRRLTSDDELKLDARYRSVLENSPSFFQVGSDVGAGSEIEIHRWLIQQACFSKLLRLHRPNLSSRAKSRTSCVLLARSILDMQRRIRQRCSVVDRLYFNLMHSFSAAIVLCLDLLASRPPAAMRTIIRSEIGEALAALRHVESSNFTARKSIRVLEALMAEEEERWNSSGGDSGSAYAQDSGFKRKRGEVAGEPRKSLLSLALRVAKATQGGAIAADEKSQDQSDEMKIDGEPDKQQDKNAVSAAMMNHLVNPANQRSSDSFVWPQVDLGSEFDKARVAPNGLEPIAASDGQQFDFNAFLAQCENSPTSTSDDHSKSTPEASSSCSSMPSLERTSTSGSSSQADSRHASFSDMPPNGADGQELDKFWSWILSQGGNEAGQQPQSQVQMAAPGSAASNNNSSSNAASNGNPVSSFTSAPTLNGGTLSLQRKPSFAPSSPQILQSSQENIKIGADVVATPSAGVDWLTQPGFFDYLDSNLDQQPNPASSEAW